MKTYILRKPKAVEPQSLKPNLPLNPPPQSPSPGRVEPQLQATVATILGRPSAASGSARFIGLDVHND